MFMCGVSISELWDENSAPQSQSVDREDLIVSSVSSERQMLECCFLGCAVFGA